MPPPLGRARKDQSLNLGQNLSFIILPIFHEQGGQKTRGGGALGEIVDLVKNTSNQRRKQLKLGQFFCGLKCLERETLRQ